MERPTRPVDGIFGIELELEKTDENLDFTMPEDEPSASEETLQHEKLFSSATPFIATTSITHVLSSSGSC